MTFFFIKHLAHSYSHISPAHSYYKIKLGNTIYLKHMVI